MKYLGIDYGTKRVGIAISDEEGSFAFPKAIVPTEEAITTITSLVKEEHIVEIVVGYSLASNNVENVLVEVVQKFTDKLSKQISIPIKLEREDFSTFEAHRYQIKAGNRDDSAAAIILQRFLDKKRST